MPPPKHLTSNGQEFKLQRSVRLEGNPLPAHALSLLGEAGLRLSLEGAGVIISSIVDSIPGAYDYELAGYPAEGYRLAVGADTIRIEALNPTGLLRAVQTLRQLAQDCGDAIEGVEITDWPAFKLRGWMHDAGRSYISPDTIKMHIDLLSRFKVNTFHWHLTENQAFRMGSRQYPQLNSPQSMTRHAGMYYTADDMRAVEKYADERGVTVIPELDMPGHSEAFVRAMGHDMQSEQGVAELLVLIDEICDAFPNAPYIHIGGDEKPIVYPDFLKMMIRKVHSRGKRVAVWNPIRGVKVSADMNVDLVTLWSTAGRKVPGVPNVDMRYNYANHFDVFSDIAGIYLSDIYYSERGDSALAGEISAYWNDRKQPGTRDIVRSNNMYAAAIASAERAWKGGGAEYIETRGVMIPAEGPEFDEFADWERRFLYHKNHTLPADEIPYVRQSDVRWHIVGPYANGGNADAVFPPENSLDNLPDSLILEAVGAAPVLRHAWGKIVPAYLTDAGSDCTAYAYTYVFSPSDRDAGALIEFQNYSRSEVDLAPDAGAWDRKGSRLWLNDIEILPPEWVNSGMAITHETNLANENFIARPPARVRLRKGWNKVFVKLPYVKADGVRLNKWMFTFVLTDPEGRDALPDIVYSPRRELR